MSLIQAPPAHPRRLIQDRLLWLAAAFLFAYCVVLTLAPVVRLHSWTALNWTHWAAFLAWFAGFELLHHEMGRLLPEADPYLLPTAALLVGWGLLTIWRLDSTMGARQAVWLVVGIFLVRAGLRKPGFLNLLKDYKYIWLTLGLIITAATLIFGVYPGGKGPHLWLGCCGVYFQPSEPLKLLLVIYLAAYLADRLPGNFSLFGLLAPSLILIGAALGLLLAQRDLGTASLFIFIYTFTLYLASGKRRMMLLAAAAILLAAVAGYRLFDVVRLRFDAWLSPWTDPSGHSYQIIQSLIAYAAGGIIGHGPGLGSPGVVPVAHSDFIFAAVAEENGLIGVFGMLLAYAVIITRGLKISISASIRFQRYLAAGVSSFFAVQTILIAGGTLRLLPLTGVTMPFVSYGGSSLVTALAGLLILISICREPEEEPAPLLRSNPYLVTGGLFMAGLLAVGSLAGWWAIFNGDALLDRPDNPRKSIADRYVARGEMLDRNNHPIVISSGSPGQITRNYLYPDLSLITGYNDPLYGQAGLESSLQSYLRGLKGIPSSTVWWSSILYGQPPQGLNVRLSIDLGLQQKADSLLGNHTGAVVLLNASTGEILAIASHPVYDANHLAENWEKLTADPNASLFNRATQGSYPAGTAIGPFITAAVLEQTSLPELPNVLTYQGANQVSFQCSEPLGDHPDWNAALRAGCPGPLVLLGKQFQPSQLDQIFERFGFYQAPDLLIPVSPQSGQVQPVKNSDLAAIGADNLTVSPLQMALAASAISTGGNIPQPVLALAFQSPNQGWVILPGGSARATINSQAASQTETLLSNPGQFYWRTLAVYNSQPRPVTWYLAGTVGRWQGTPLAIAVVLEEDNAPLAETIGRGVIESALH